MTDINKTLTSLSNIAQQEVTPVIDVRWRVMQTLSQQHWKVPQKRMALSAFTGIAVAASIGGVLLLLPAWQAMFDPWSFFF